MRKFILIAVFTVVLTPLFSQNINESIDNSIKQEVRLHPDVRLKYAHTSFSIDKYVIVDPYILIYSNTTASFYLINQREQLIVDQLDIFKTYPKIKPLDLHFRDHSGARIKLLSPFYNNGLASHILQLEKYNDHKFFAGLIKQKGKFYTFLVHIENDQIISSLKNYDIEKLFEKPSKRNIEFRSFTIEMDLLKHSTWNKTELFQFTFDPYVQKQPKDSANSIKFLYENSIYQLHENKIENIYKSQNTTKHYHHTSYITKNNQLYILDNQKDSLILINKNYDISKSIKLPRSNLDSIRIGKKKILIKDGSIIKDEFNKALYFVLYNNKTYEVFSISDDLNKVTRLKTFISELALNKLKIYNGQLYFIVKTNTSEPNKLFSYDLYNCGYIDDTIVLSNQTQEAFSLFRGNLDRDWFRSQYGMEHQENEIYQIPSNGLQHKICKEKLNSQERSQKNSIDSLLQLIGKLYQNKQTNKILAHLTCYDKFEYKILDKKVKEDSFNSKVDSIFYKSEITEVFEYITSPDFMYEGEMKTYHYEVRTGNNWTFYFYKKDDQWYLTSVAYKQKTHKL